MFACDANACVRCGRSLITLLPRLPAPVTAALDAPLVALHVAALDAVSPIFRALVEAMEAKLGGMHALHQAHRDRGGDGVEGGMMDTSGFVADVAASLGFFRCWRNSIDDSRADEV
jgi:hypothetical protein